MSDKALKYVRLCYTAVFCALTAVVAVLFIWQTLNIYITGTSPDYTGVYIFTRERVSQALYQISVPTIIWLSLAVLGIIFWLIFPENKKKKFSQDAVYTLKRVKKRISANGDAFDVERNLIKREEKIINYAKLACAVITLAVAVYAIIYLAIPTNFPKTDVTGEILNLVKWVFPFVAVCFACWCAVAIYEEISAKKQLPYAKKLAVGKKAENQQKAQNAVLAFVQSQKFLIGAKIAVAAVGVALFVIGIFNGGMRDVLVKAINICTECIGLG